MKKGEILRRDRTALGVLCLVQFVDVLGVTVVVTALPAMLSALDAAPSAAAFVMTGYATCFGGLLMLAARLGDRFGHRRVLVVGLAGFGVASLLAATAGSLPALVAARCLQGTAAALSVPTALRLLLAAAGDETARRRALAAWSAAGAAAGGSGFVVGGVITELVGWRTLYWMNLPLAAALLAGVLINAPGPPGSRGTRLDVAGAATLTASIMAVVAGASLLEHPAQRPLGAAALVLGAVLLVAFIAVERRAAHPLLPADAVRHPRLRFAAGASALNTATTSAAATLATLYLHNERGLGATATGLLLLPFSVCVVAGSTAATRLLRRQPPRASIALGLTTIATGIAILLALPLTVALLPAAFAIAGLGIGISSVAANTLGTDLPPDLQGVATGALNTAAQLGTALGVSLLVLVATATNRTGLPLAGTTLGWAAAAIAALTGALLARPTSPQRRTLPADRHRSPMKEPSH